MEFNDRRPPKLHIASPKRTAGGDGRLLVSVDELGTVGAIRMRTKGKWEAHAKSVTRAGLIGEYETKEAAAQAAHDHYVGWQAERRKRLGG